MPAWYLNLYLSLVVPAPSPQSGRQQRSSTVAQQEELRDLETSAQVEERHCGWMISIAGYFLQSGWPRLAQCGLAVAGVQNCVTVCCTAARCRDCKAEADYESHNRSRNS